MLGAKELAKYIDHTLLSPTASRSEILMLCEEAKRWGFATVCVQPYFLKLCSEQLSGSQVGLCTVIGFPLGQNTIETKAYETQQALLLGATEIDMVINISALKEGHKDYLINEISHVVSAAKDCPVKVIIETCLLSPTEIATATHCCEKANAHYIKTSTGFSIGGAKPSDIETIQRARTTNLKIKASGGIRDLKSALEFIQMGVDRIGTSKGVTIVESLKNEL